MHLIFKRKQLIISALIVALAAALFVNWYLTERDDPLLDKQVAGEESEQYLGAARHVSADEGETEAVSSDFFINARLSRDAAHDEVLQGIKAAMAGLDGEDTQMSQELKALSGTIKLESDIETLVSAKTGSDCVAVINDDAISIIVSSSAINDSSVIQIKDIVISNSDISSEGIKIVGVEQ